MATATKTKQRDEIYQAIENFLITNASRVNELLTAGHESSEGRSYGCREPGEARPGRDLNGATD